MAESSGSDLLEQSSLSSAPSTDESRALSEDASASVSMSDVRTPALALLSLLPGSECFADGECLAQVLEELARVKRTLAEASADNRAALAST